MNGAPLTREQVIQTLGEVDDSIIAEVISTGATSADLAFAITRLRIDSSVWNRRREPGRRARSLCEVLAAWWQADDGCEYLGTD